MTQTTAGIATGPFPNVWRDGTKLYLRVYPAVGAAPVVVEMEVSEALGLAIDLTNKARVVIEMSPAIPA